jgi:hypothetical protein
MGTRKHRERQESLWYRAELVEAPEHPFYRKLDRVLVEAGFDHSAKNRAGRFTPTKRVVPH